MGGGVKTHWTSINCVLWSDGCWNWKRNWELKVEIVKTSKKRKVSTSMFKLRSRKKVSVNFLPGHKWVVFVCVSDCVWYPQSSLSVIINFAVRTRMTETRGFWEWRTINSLWFNITQNVSNLCPFKIFHFTSCLFCCCQKLKSCQLLLLTYAPKNLRHFWTK